MEESYSAHCERDNDSSEKIKRMLKTPAQIQALEKFYNEHKYPSEAMKLQFAEQIGLSEKQVSGWFCHRRSKDKKLLQDEGYTNRKQALSTGGVHDNNSGLRQESCNSTKQADRCFDGKEVQSNRFGSQKYFPTISGQRNLDASIETYGVPEDRSSGSSTTSYERLLKQNVRDHFVESKYPHRDENHTLPDTKNIKKRGHIIDDRSYSQGYMESPALVLVKLKLGMQYREDGPPLATNFDPLPPGAFDSPIGGLNAEPYYVGDSVLLRSCSGHLVVGNHKVYDSYGSEKITGSRLGGSGFDRKLLKHENDFTDQFTTKDSDPKNNIHAPNLALTMDEEGEKFAEEAFNDFNIRSLKHRLPRVSDRMDVESDDFGREAIDYHGRSNLRSLDYTIPRDSENMISHHFNSNCLKASAKNLSPYPISAHKYSAPMSEKELFHAKTSKRTVKSITNEYLNTVDSRQPKGKLKVLKKKVHKHNRVRGNSISVWPNMHMASDRQMARKMHCDDLGSKML